MKYFKILTVFLAVTSTFVVIYTGIFPFTQAVSGERGIARLEEVELGGMNQWISIRGEDKTNPILLWLHGGPGLAQMPLAHYLDSELEKEYVVVHWDQRGAGKSNPLDFDESTMTEEQFLSDAYELVKYLQDSLGQEKIYLLGHSWGSKLGIELVNMYPEDFHAFISVTQIVNIEEGLDISYEWLKNEIERNDDVRSLEKLEKIGEPPYNIKRYRDFANIMVSYGGNIDLSREELIRIGIQAPEYTFLEYIQWLDGALRNAGPIWSTSDEHDIDYRDEITSVDVPIYFFAGRNDYTTPLVLIEDYFEKIQAPKKELIIFENSAHTPFLKESEKFYNEVINVKEN
jgi:pimeloyl-ACP methyl ester carboxylesterase